MKIRLKLNFESRKQVEELAFAMGIREENINYNTAYLDAFGIEIMDIFGLAVIVSFILFIAVIVVLNIYNIYFGQNIRIKINKGMSEIITDMSALSFLTAAVTGYFIVLFASSSPLRKMMQISVTGAYHYNPVNIKTEMGESHQIKSA